VIRICFIVLSLLVFSVCSQAQEPVYFEYNDEGGLPSNEVYSIIQDKKGLIWIGCDAGLYKFDGFRYRHYTCPTQKSKSIAELCLSNTERLYCFNFQGQIFYLEGDSLKELSHSISGIPNLLPDQSGHLIVNHLNGIDILDEKENKWNTFKKISKDEHRREKLVTNNSSINDKGEVFFTSEHGIGKLQNNYLQMFYNECFTNESPGRYRATCWQEDYWIFHVQDNLVLKFTGNKIAPVKNNNLTSALEGRKITNVKNLPDGKIWICTYKGILSYDPKTDLAKVYYPDFAFSDCLIDREGNYWFTTLHAGIIRVPNLNYQVWNSNNRELKINSVTKVTGDEQHIYFTTGDGYLGWLCNFRGPINYFHTGNYADIQCLNYERNDQCLYFFLNSKIYNLKNNYVVCLSPVDIPPIKVIKKIKSEYVLASSMGAFIGKKNQGTNCYIITNSWTRDILVDTTNQKLWLATNTGLMPFKKFNNRWQCVDTIFKNNQILSLSASSKSNGFYALSFNGNIYFVANNGTTHLETTLPKHVQPSKLISHNDKLYVATNKGLWTFQNKKWNTINRFSGLASDMVQDLYIHKENIWLATGKGLQKIPTELQVKTIPPLVYLKALYLDSHVIINRSDIKLNYGQLLTLKPEASSYNSLGKFNYVYKIKNSGYDWHYLPGNIEEINIPNIPAGDFQIELKIVDHLGNFSENTITISGFVHPPVWKTIWFITLCILTILAIAFIIFRYRIQVLKKRQAQEIERINLEKELRFTQQTALKAQMNPHFIFNVLNSIKGYIYENDKKNAVSYLNSFSTLIRQVLENSSKNKVRLSEEIAMLSTYIALEEMLLVETLDYKIHIDNKLCPDDFEIPGMLIQPFIENAFKHGLRHQKGTKKLVVSFDLINSDTLKISITDNGIGRKASGILQERNKNTIHQSFAGNATNRRIKLLNLNAQESATIQIIDHENTDYSSAGTTVIITLIVQHEFITN